ncbi:MAG TPA: hypothetical protein VKA89_04905 [Solirubrobacterales bacterium]|nr:hypothetical protein [Solirubrobacterales bacterium]
MTLRAKIALCAVATTMLLPVAAAAHGDFGARAAQPTFNGRTLRLSGAGGYGTTRTHQAIRVTVCLEKRYRGSFFDVKCKTVYDSDRRVRARVGVAGCVRGVWRTTATGEALGRGTWKHADSAVGPPYRCD